MKRITIILFSLLLTTALFAQEEMGGLGIHIGYAAPTLRINTPTSGQKLETIPMNGMKVGISYDATIVKGFGTTLGLNYTFGTYQSKWVTSDNLYSTNRYSYRDTYQGLELFCDWQYKFEIAGNTYLMLYTGPTIQFHLSLKEQEYIRTSDDTHIAKGSEVYYGYTYRDNESFEDYKRLNVTWGVGAGFQYKQFFIRGGYDFGLLNPYKSDQFPARADGTKPWTHGKFDQWQIKLGMYIWQN